MAYEGMIAETIRIVGHNGDPVSAYVARPLGAGFEIFGAVENATNRRNEAGKTPVTTLAPPRIFRGGIRWTM